MNGATVPVLVWLVNGLLALVMILIGFIVRQHLKSDDEHRKRQDREIERLREKMDKGRRLLS